MIAVTPAKPCRHLAEHLCTCACLYLTPYQVNVNAVLGNNMTLCQTAILYGHYTSFASASLFLLPSCIVLAVNPNEKQKCHPLPKEIDEHTPSLLSNSDCNFSSLDRGTSAISAVAAIGKQPTCLDLVCPTGAAAAAVQQEYGDQCVEPFDVSLRTLSKRQKFVKHYIRRKYQAAQIAPLIRTQKLSMMLRRETENAIRGVCVCFQVWYFCCMYSFVCVCMCVISLHICDFRSSFPNLHHSV